MKIESVSTKYFVITLRAMTFVLLISMVLLLFFIANIKNKENLISRKDLASSISAMQRDISERFSILASTQLFIDYLRSGELSRERLKLDMNLLVSPNVDESITGIEIQNTTNEIIYSYGLNTHDSVKLKLCYLDNSLNYKFGQCVGYITLYFSVPKVLTKLKQMNPQIESCPSCKIKFFNESNQFGSLKTEQVSLSILNIKQKTSNLEIIYIVALAAFSLAIIVFITLHRSLRRVSEDYIYQPIRNIVAHLEAGQQINVEGINVQEIKFVAEKFNEYVSFIEERESLKTNSKLVELAARVAHDIRSPISVLDVLLDSPNTIPIAEKEMLSLATKRISEIANNLLVQKKNVSKAISLIALIQEVLKEKKLELSKRIINLDLILENELREDVFINLSASDFKSILSNLINNSIEACNNLKIKYIIRIVVSRSGDKAKISIQDNGPGIHADIIKKLFHSEFSSGKQNGNGIGLFSANKLLREVGGAISIESKLGTLVIISVPCNWT